ncbi:MAG: asparagine synthase (glutamine-hydrolyzing) [Bacteroidetes bacterium]|jgi:asparagine synthase (glutamine-hydrolysing)|nr:asparagine synthase (glutamine-hydrolyzing) [Bacteroidota bacterium]
MCGIAGTYSVNGFFSKGDIQAAADKLLHRGPDGYGFFEDEKVLLAHRRLSIIDLDERASQPMYSHDGRYVMVYNGEVYNYVELKEKIIKEHSDSSLAEFKTTSDSEVALRLFEIYGPDFVTELNGMFAICIYDRQEGKLYLFRDRIGIKPLFWYQDAAGNLAFASELKALMAMKNISREIDEDAIFYFLRLGFIPAPLTVFKHIHKLESGTYLTVSAEGVASKKFWQAAEQYCADKLNDEKIIQEKLHSTLSEAVKIQLRSDVPYGIFLSGGVDSSLVTALASKHVNGKLNTFSIGFKEHSHNEAPHARAVAAHLGTNHHEFIVSHNDAIGLIETFFDVYDEPYADTSGIPTMLVSNLASQHVKVVLSGEGGDELFFGYGTHNWSKRLKQFPFNICRVPLRILFSQLSSRYQRVSKLLDYDADSIFLPEHIYSQEQYLFNIGEMEGMLSKHSRSHFKTFTENYAGTLRSKYGNLKNIAPEELQSFFEIKFSLQDDLLTKVDRATMHHSIEARVPLLDNNVVQLALQISPEEKIKNGVNKYPLKKMLSEYLPEDIFMRPKKGFSIPLVKWLKNEWSYLINDYLNDKVVEQVGLFEPQEIRKLVNQFFEGSDFLYNRIWCLIALHRWFIKNT